MRIIYIVNWPYHNHRELPKSCPWRKDKVDFQGDDWQTVMAHRHAAEAILAYKVLADLAILSPFRGLVLTDGTNPKPHDLTSICKKTFARRRKIELGMNVLMSVVRWVGIIDWGQSCSDLHGKSPVESQLYTELSLHLWGAVYTRKQLTTNPARDERGDQSGSSAAPARTQRGSSAGSSAEEPRLEEKKKEKKKEREREKARVSPPAPEPLPPIASGPTASLSLPSAEPTTTTTAPADTSAPAQPEPPEFADPVVKTVAVGIGWGVTNLHKVQEQALRLRREFPDEAFLVSGLSAVCLPGVVLWPQKGKSDVYACMRHWAFEERRRLRAAKEAAPKTETYRTPTDAEHEAWRENLKQACPGILKPKKGNEACT